QNVATDEHREVRGLTGMVREFLDVGPGRRRDLEGSKECWHELQHRQSDSVASSARLSLDQPIGLERAQYAVRGGYRHPDDLCRLGLGDRLVVAGEERQELAPAGQGLVWRVGAQLVRARLSHCP